MDYDIQVMPPNLSGTSIDKLSLYFKLSNDFCMQDWEIEVANKDQIAEFVKGYVDFTSTDEDKIALMSLIIASMDQLLKQIIYQEVNRLQEFDRYWREVKNLLVQDIHLHKNLILYWYRLDAENCDEYFSISPYIRGLNIDIENLYTDYVKTEKKF